MIKSYTQILTELCDAYDASIAPKYIRRSNLNFIYLVLKAVAKGYEVVNNLVEAMKDKFQPDLCDDTDLVSTGILVGTKFLAGKGSGLVVTILNTSAGPLTLLAGEYFYAFDDTVKFLFTIATDTIIDAASSINVVAISDTYGSYQVGIVNPLPVYRSDSTPIDPEFTFSCIANDTLLGRQPETPLEFRNRILSESDRQDAIKELEMEIKNLPYILDCNIRFNQTASDVVIDGITVPPLYMLITLLGDPRDEIADIIASRSIYPSVVIDPLKVMHSYGDNYIGGKYDVFFNPFGYSDYTLDITYRYDSTIISNAAIVAQLETALAPYKVPSKYVKNVVEGTYYKLINDLGIPSLELLDVKIIVGGVESPYITVEPTRIARLIATNYVVV